MRKLNSKELREEWIKFYEERGHKDIGKVSLIGDGTTGVLFNVAGMQPLMPYLLGMEHPLGKRLCNVQGCVRTVDIDSVGDNSHATFFEMMGSWSLGDYFKEDRIKWSFDLFTKVLGIPQDRLATTCFIGDENAPKDIETYEIKKKVGFKEENIYFLPKSDNWWEIEKGPCGPDSEYFYITDKEKCSEECNPSCSCGHFIEIGNDVFMEYEKIDKDKYIPLKNKNVDTGWGLERILAFLNTDDVDIYKTDLYIDALKMLEEKVKIKYNTDSSVDKSYRIILDHIRTSVMLIGDEKRLTPSNTGAGYILRRLIRRCVRHTKKLNIDSNIIISLATHFIDNVYNESYPNLTLNKTFIINELEKEIDRFSKTLSNGIKELDKMIDTSVKDNTLDAKLCFKLYDTYGFPFELTKEILNEKNINVDKEEFDKYINEQKQLAKSAVKKDLDIKVLGDIKDFKEESLFTGYDNLKDTAKVIFVGDNNGNIEDIYSEGIIITDKTPFYATMGGQKGDVGIIYNDNFKAEVLKTEKAPNGQALHFIRIISGEVKKGDIVNLEVDAENRFTTCQNHSATHLLQKALQEVLGSEVRQAGSYVDGKILRFDFNYTGKIKDEDIIKTEKIVNEKIKACYKRDTKIMTIDEAKKMGAMALFDEKYSDNVRVVTLGDSTELCGGTHVTNTGNIRSFAIKKIESKGLNVYRIEAVCDTNLEIELFKEIKPYNDEMILLLNKAKKIVSNANNDNIKLDIDINISNERPKCYHDVLENKEEVFTLKKQVAKLEKEYKEKLISKKTKSADKYLENKIKGIYGEVVIEVFDNEDMGVLKSLAGSITSKLDNGIVLLINKKEDAINFIAKENEVLKDKVNLGEIIKDISKIAEGNGGGSPIYAQGGGTNPLKLDMIITYFKSKVVEE